MQSGNEKLIKCCCSITKVNSTERTMFLTWFFLLFFFLFRNQFIHFQPAVAFGLVFMWMKYTTITLQIGSEWDQLSFRSISSLTLYKCNCCYVIGLLWTWNRRFYMSQIFVGFILIFNEDLYIHFSQHLIVCVIFDFNVYLSILTDIYSRLNKIFLLFLEILDHM